VDKILWEVTAGALGRAPQAVADDLPARVEEAAEVEEEDKEEDLEEMRSRLQALRS